MSIRELFRQKLENAEIVPDALVGTKLMSKLTRREFLRFYPARFNIYYLGGILVAGITAAFILSSGILNSDQLAPSNLPGERIKTDSTEYLNVPVEQSVTQKSDKLSENATESIKNKVISRPKVESKMEPAQKSEPRENTSVIPAGVNDSFSKRGLFSESSADKNKLQGRFRTDEILFEPSDTEGCAPLKIRFYNKLTDYDSCRWTFGDGGSSSKKNPEWIFDVEGEYKVVLKVFGSDGLLAISSTIVTVYPKPLARFEISPEKVVLPDDEIRFLNYSADAVKFNWDFGDGSSSELFEPLHRYTKFGNYNIRLKVSSEYGCSDSLVVLNAFSGSAYFIDFPNAFVPNPEGPTGGFYSSKSDEAAQVFHPVFSGVSEYQLKIFSKLGIIIFESSDINIGWDGYFKGQLSNSGVYIWKVRGNFRNGEPFIKMGDVTLLRNL
ncbi:MAG: PKD domain-containing protein [Bacteroidia bacterium]|nr:PKD domain-containing protein [Bacteroidia bacterium]